MSKWREMTRGDRDCSGKWQGSACDGYGERSDRSMDKVGANEGDGYDPHESNAWGRQGPEREGDADKLSNAGRRIDQYKGGDSTKHGPGFAARPWGRD